jgi:hypothetical protein
MEGYPECEEEYERVVRERIAREARKQELYYEMKEHAPEMDAETQRLENLLHREDKEI